MPPQSVDDTRPRRQRAALPGPVGASRAAPAGRFDVRAPIGRVEIGLPVELSRGEPAMVRGPDRPLPDNEAPAQRHRVHFESVDVARHYLSRLPLLDRELAALRHQVLRVHAPQSGGSGGALIDAAANALVQRTLALFHTPPQHGGGGQPVPPVPPPPGPGPNPPPKPRVNPLIEPSSVIVVVQKFHTPPAGARQPYTFPKRRPVVLTTDAGFDGTGLFTRSSDTVRFFKSAKGKDELKFDGAANVFKGADLTRGVRLFAEAARPSGAMDDVKLSLELSGGSKINGPAAKGKATAVEATLDICTFSPPAGGPGPVLSTDDKIDPGRPILMQNAEKKHDRAMLIVQKLKPANYTGDVVVKARGAGVSLFLLERPAAGEGQLAPFTMAAADIPGAGTKMWVEGAAASAAMRDTGFQLGLVGVEDDADHLNITVVDAVLDIGQSRSKTVAESAEPAAMSAADKLNVGRFVHEQDGNFHHGRAMLAVRKVKPGDFKGTLVLDTFDAAKAQLFPKEIHAAGEAAIACPHELAYPAVKNVDHLFWVEGKAVSGALRDAGYSLRLKDDRPANCDAARVTVVRFTNLKADIPSTPANQVRNSRNGAGSNSPVARHTLTLAGGAANPTHYDHDYATHIPVVLIEGSVRAADPVKLSVAVAPAAAAPFVRWSIPRDRRKAAPKGDVAAIVALAGNSEDPGLVGDAAKTLEATLTANAVGSFHVQPYIDNNGNNHNEFDNNKGERIDREPYICLNLVLVRVQGVSNLSLANSAARDPTRPATRVMNYFGAGNLVVPANFSSGDFAGTGNDAVTMHVVAHLVGGGPDGKRGLDQVFGAWSNNELDCPTSPGPGGHGEDVTGTYRQRNPPAPAPANPVARTRSFWQLDGAETAGPMLDAGRFALPNRGTGGNTCTSTDGLAPIEPAGTVDPSGLGERREYLNPDSPGGGILLEHPNDTGIAPPVNRRTLRNFKFNIDFRCALLFWTNRDKVSGAVDKPACRLYSSVSTNTWTVRFESNYDDNFAATRVVAQKITLFKDDKPTRRATPIDGSGFETRAPGGTDVLVTDVPFV